MSILERGLVSYLRNDHDKARSFLSEYEKTMRDARLHFAIDDKREFEWLKEKLAR